ncbi:M48 family metallopeptidase [Limnospira fusiformis]|uniref:M48 family metallopeptidase n=1 Tax=Limnospira fusiformis TaxID=54297 RepID=UPI002AA179A0|nr:M48 family metallopeptidase [Limnospira fusiformis LS22]
MNFFEHQDQARQNTVYLLGLFLVAVIVMIALLYGVVVYALHDNFLIWRPELLLLVALGVVATVGGGSVYKSIQLRGGGKVVAEDLGGTLVDRMTGDELEKRLLNIVEEMAIASGISVPEVYVLGEEKGINAFAAGFTPNDAVIGVTRGCLEQLDRDELQGVIAHEFSHILNGDMRLNLRLIGVIQGLILIYIMGRVMLRGSWWGGSGNSSSKGKDSGLIIGLGMVVIGGIGFFCGRLIKSAVSRQREFLADASAVQFTRNPDGISGALQKIAGYKSGSKVTNPRAEEASHLFFGEAFTGIFESFGQIFATHPPVKERVKRLEGFAGRTWSVEETGNNASMSSIASGNEMVAGFAGSSPQPQPQPESLSVSPDRVVAGVGTTNPKHLDNVRGFLADIPEPVRMATRDVNGAIAIIYSLLLHTDPEVRDRQMSSLRESSPPPVLEMIQNLSPYLESLNARTRLPLIDLAIPALRGGSVSQCTQLLKQARVLIQADNHLSLSEYAIFVVLRQRLTNYFPATQQEPKVKFTEIKQIWSDCVIVLSALARVGQDSPGAVDMAFQAGLLRLPRNSGETLPTQPGEYSLTQVGESLKRLELAAPKLKQAVVDACAYTVLADHHVTLDQAELLRAIVISLNCPIPPFLDAPSSANQR